MLLHFRIKVFQIFLLFISKILLSKCDYCNYELIGRTAARLSASSEVSKDKAPKYAILHEGSAWTAGQNDLSQYLQVDLGRQYNISAIGTQGRQHTNEYIQEFKLESGIDGHDYSTYRDRNGNIKLFNGNSDGNSVVINRFDPPIIAQFIRINPTRWRDRISMRIQLYGCDYHAISLHFDGQSMVVMDLKKRPIDGSYDDVFRFRMRTNEANGNIIYTKGTQGDFMALQLIKNKLIFSIDLGGGGRMESISAGSLLDDNLWHDVYISRQGRNVLFAVDRVLVRHQLQSDFARLNLDNDLFIGGIPIKFADPLNTRVNFSGCIENLTFNTTNIAYEIQTDERNFVYGKVGQIQYSCHFPQVVPLTFNTPESHIKVEGFMVPFMNTSFDFRTFNDQGLLLYHKFSSEGFVMLNLEKGKIVLRFQGKETPVVTLEPFDQLLNDGSWHTVVLNLQTNKIILSIDGIPSETVRSFTMYTGQIYLIGGGFYGYAGFVGCMRWIYVEGRYVNVETLSPEKVIRIQENDITIKACQMIDRCHPNPCEHGGQCKQDNVDFGCDCTLTGYMGAVCHVSRHPLSCLAYKIDNPKSKKADVKLDVDGSGPLEPFYATCIFPSNERAQTIIHHRNENPTEVRGFHLPGSYAQDINYDTPFDQIIELVNRSYVCQQKLKYECFNARLLNTPVSQGVDLQPFSWWVSRNNQKMDYWGGSLPGSKKCACGLYGSCKDPRKWCNCDAATELLNQNEWLVDEGDLSQREFLPVRQLRFGDTGGDHMSKRIGRYTLGPLLCEGDSIFEDIVTFRHEDATIDLSPFDLGHAFDIYLQFKTTAEFGVLFHNKGPEDFIKLAIVNGKTIQFSFSAGNGIQQVSVEASYRLNDNIWHSISVEKNKKEARIVVDGQLTNEQRQSLGSIIRPFHLTSHFVLGATVEYREGYVGCVRALLVNGKFINLNRYAKQNLYGISSGCVGKCQSSPCLNNGTCIDHYNGYTCDCQWTAFKGPICADEIGVNLRSDYYIKYDFETSISTLEEFIRVGFTTTEHRGLILGVNSFSGEYLNLLMSASGHLRLVFDFGFERQEIIIKNENFALGQHHDITIRRYDKGAKVKIVVDSYEPKIYTFKISQKADAQFNRIKSIYIGRNETMDTGEGFIGCISRVTFDDHFPLRRLFQENKRGNVQAFPQGAEIREDTCGIEPVVYPTEKIETRPPPTLEPGVTLPEPPTTVNTGAIVGAVIFAIVIIIVVAAIASGRIMNRQKGDYLTHEDKGAEDALDPDTAVIKGKTGPDVSKKKEYFI